MYLSPTIWVFWFKLFRIMPMPYHSFKDKWKALRLINYQITSANNITIISKRLYKNNFENTVYKNYNNSHISRCS